jgi:hypothetical protein
MAKVTGAAASSMVLVVLLMSVALGAAQPQPQGILAQLFAAWFPQGSLPPPVRIYCRQDAALNVAVRDGRVVLANANCSDLSQARLLQYIRHLHRSIYIYASMMHCEVGSNHVN